MKIKRKEKITVKNNVTFLRLARIIIASLILICTVCSAASCAPKKVGNVASVTVDGELVGEYPLSLDATYTLNGGTNVLTIEGGKAYMSYSTCAGHDCENWGKVQYVNQSIICLPNKIVITIVATDSDSPSDGDIDFVS